MNETFGTLAIAVASGAVAFTMAACGNSNTSSENDASGVSASDTNTQLPVTIKHVFDEITIKEAPQ